jgi:F420-non-reducing hydrogenase iron-sulfur subunit
MINLSAAMGGQFAWSAAELTEEIRRLGPNPLKPESREDWVKTGISGEEEAK